jgi:hypothetical protein
MFRLKEDDDSDFSSFQPVFVYTFQNQIVANITSILNWNNNYNKIKGNIGYFYYSESFFFGIRNNINDNMKERLAQETFIFNLSYQRKIWKNLRFGIGYNF